MLEVIVNEKEIVQGLMDIGVEAGCEMLVHSSLSSFGYVEGGAQAVIRALLQAVGDTGTLIVPTLTGSEALTKDNPPVFDYYNMPCWTGKIPETLRKMDCAIRSVHPTHSVAGIGPGIDGIISTHRDSMTPCDELSPYGKLAGHDNAYVLLIGVDLESATMLHHVEEVAKADYHLQKDMVRAKIIIGEESYYKELYIHKYGSPRNFSRIEDTLVETGVLTYHFIGNSKIRLIKAKEFVEVSLRAIREDPEYFIK